MEPSEFANVLPAIPPSQIQQWLQDDCPTFDVGGFVVGTKLEEAWCWGKSSGVMAGAPFFTAVFEHVGCTVEWLYPEGAQIDVSNGKVVVAKVRGPARNLLLGERTALNIMSRASGIATQARRMRALKDEHGWHGEVAATRKVTPGFRLVEKYATLVGGASTHRMDLSHMVMLKDNHIWSCGGITHAVEKARRACGFSSKIEVECSSFEDAVEAAEAGAEIAMLDNFEPDDLKATAKRLKTRFPHLIIEASGGITESTAAAYFSPDVDVLSRSLTQGYPCLDFSLKIQVKGKL
jgi:nicotinate-nucleotide pyrophosphorylase (carboxylating)